MSILKEEFNREGFQTALRWLDQAIGQSEVLAEVIPMHMVSYGGFLSVCLFGIRESTRDIDVLLPPNVRDSRVHLDEFTRLVKGVATELGYMQDWINDDLRLFVPTDQRQRLLEDSIEQGVAAFEGHNLVIWAGVWEFGLESKLHRIHSNQGQSSAGGMKLKQDVSDAVELVHRLRGDSALPLSKSWVMGLRRFGPNPRFDNAIKRVMEAYIAKYSTQGIVELVWDVAAQRYMYQNLAGEWVRYG